jgi:hypothetical protein
MTKKIIDENLVSPCGFYCGVCKSFLKNKCKGCSTNTSSWARKCKVRKCCSENDYTTCAECQQYEHVNECKKLNSNFVKFFSVFVGYDRPGGINEIRRMGKSKFAQNRIDSCCMWVKKK